jgi:hypothetical protein
MLKKLATTKGYSLKIDTETGRLYYYYVTPGWAGKSCCFSLLCEVGHEYQKWFRKQLKYLSLKAVPCETKTDYYEVGVKL